MADHLKNWLQKNKEENDEVLKNIRTSADVTSETQRSPTHQITRSQADPDSVGEGQNDGAQQLQIASTSGVRLQQHPDPIPSTSGVQTTNESLRQQNLNSNIHVTKPSDLVFENNSLKMTILKAAHLQEKKFKAWQNLFYLLLAAFLSYVQSHSHSFTLFSLSNTHSLTISC